MSGYLSHSELHGDQPQLAIPSSHTSATPPSQPHDPQSKPKKEPYSIFTRPEKWFIVALVSYGSLFSPLTTSIYLVAIPTLSSTFHTSIEHINLSVTVYMIAQAITPMVWGPLADRYGRRLPFVACMITLSLASMGLALIPTSAYWLLLVLRFLQSAGSASTVALAAGVIGDLASTEERGGFYGTANMGPLLGPAIGPIIGGGLLQDLGWRAIFWFLVIAAGVSAVLIFLVLPETLRTIVGNGSIKPPAYLRPPLPVVGRSAKIETNANRPPARQLQNPLKLFLHWDVVLILLFAGIGYSVMYGVLAPLSVLIKEVYPSLTDTELGLCYLAIGGGTVIGTVTTGRFLDKEYKRIEAKLKQEAETDPESKHRTEEVTNEEHYPIEVARLRIMIFTNTALAASCVGYGWCLERKVSIAGPLVLQALVGALSVANMTGASTLLVDLFPTMGSSITACNNIVRCTLGAVMVSVIDLMLRRLGMGWTYVLLGGLAILCTPLVIIEMKTGPKWRERRRKQGEQPAAQVEENRGAA